MVKQRKPDLISIDSARVQWNQMSRNVKADILKKLGNKIHQKDTGEAGYFFGNLYPKTRQAIRKYLSK